METVADAAPRGHQPFEVAQDEQAITHACRRVLTLCGEWVDAGRWRLPFPARITAPADVTCALCLCVLERERDRNRNT